MKQDNSIIGFIAQEVKDVLPNAISVLKDFIPNEMKLLKDISWERFENSDNEVKYKLRTSELKDVNGIKYRFYLSNYSNGKDEIMKEVVGKSDNSFVFDKEYKYVYCYGKEVDDFHIIDRDQIFTLYHSAIQEIDQKQQEDKKEIDLLKHENNLLKQQLSSVIERLNALENK